MNKSSEQRELHGIRLLGYALGNFGVYLARIYTMLFSFQYYVYTINLDTILVSTSLSFNLILSAIFSIIFGVMTDNKKPGKFGKRKPFLLYGLPVWFISNVLIWFPPLCPADNSWYLPTTVFLWTIQILSALSGTLIGSTLLSMLPEQSTTHENREKVASINTIFQISGSILAMALPLIVQSLVEDPNSVKHWETSGKILMNYIPLIGASFMIFGVLAVLFSFFSVDESFHKDITSDNEVKKTIKETFRQILAPIRNIKFRKYLIVTGSYTSGSRIMGILIMPFLSIVLNFRGEQMLYYIFLSIISKFTLYYLWKAMLKKAGLMKTYEKCFISSIIATLMLLIFLFPLDFGIKMIFFIFIVGTILGSMYATGLFIGPLTGSLIYEAAQDFKAENNHRNNISKNVKNNINNNEAITKISGAYTGLLSFITAIGQSIASLIAGVVLSGDNQNNASVITIFFSSMSIFYIFSLIFLKQIKIQELELK